MADIPGNSSTTSTIAVGGTVSGTLETLGDHDWFRITLTAGQSITVFVDGITLEDPYLYVRNSSGALIYENDDINPGIDRDSRLSFTVNESGTYYLDIGAWDEKYTGDYTVSVSIYTPPPLVTNDAIANQLVEGYWGGADHHFNVSQGGSLTVNLTALTPAGQNLAREALKLWSDVIGVQFVEVATGGQITFDDNESGAFADSNWSGGITSSAQINVSTQWLTTYGTGLNSYSFQTYVHEIGHALGLGHAGNYNGEASYPFDALFQNDAWAASVMSYFSQTENTYFAGQGFTESFIVTPMVADIIAMSTLYGLSTTTRTGNTTYGFNSTAGRAVYDAAQNPGVAYTIFDSGGTDTLDYSGFANNQLINLNAETFSNVGAEVGNVSIARGVVIENAIGGSGNDTLIGNAAANILTGNAGNDVLNGRAGADVMIGGLGNDRFVIDNSADQVVEAAGQGDDWALASTSYALGAEAAVEVLSTVNGDGTQAISLTGNGFSQSIYGNAGDNFLSGGGGGADYLAGGAGNDRFFVDQDDSIAELAGEGDDWVLASTNYQLTAGAAVEVLSTANGNGTQPIALTGNGFSQSIYGNAGDNILSGGGGADYLAGGAGNDRFFVDQDDSIAELAGGGDDWAIASTNYQLTSGAAVEVLSTINGNSTVALALTGNELSQSIYGNAGDNILSGGGGADYLAGGAGNDRYLVDQDDTIVELAGDGADWAIASSNYVLNAGAAVETLSTVNGDGTQAIALTGNEFSQTIYGNAGDNVLTGAGGADRLAGGSGNDVFVLSDLALTGIGHIATIMDYASGDVVDLSKIIGFDTATDVVGAGYLRITSSGQMQVDTNGGGDNWTTVANVSGSGSVTVRYLTGGSVTDLSVARSAAQTTMMAAAVAAAGMAAIPAAAKEPADSSGDLVAAEMTAPSLMGRTLEAPTIELRSGDRLELSAEPRETLEAVTGAAPSLAGKEASIETDPDVLATADSVPVSALPQGTEVPFAQPLVADGVAMPSAEQLQALTGTAEVGQQQQQLVAKVLIDALAGGADGGPIDAVLDSLASGPALASVDHLAQIAAAAENGNGAFTAVTWVQSTIVAEALAAHPDAIAAA